MYGKRKQNIANEKLDQKTSQTIHCHFKDPLIIHFDMLLV